MRHVTTTSKPRRKPEHARRGRLLFFGIYQIGVDALTALMAGGHEIAAVVTKPDGAEEVQPVAALARHLKIPLFSPPTLAMAEVIAQMHDLAPDLIAVAGYHQKLPHALLDFPPLGAINLHGSLLPRYRGPTPWKWAIIHGEQEIGATVHVMTERIDRGDILGQAAVPITDEDTGESLFRKISATGAPLLADVVRQILAGTARRRPQDEALASYFPTPTDEDCQIDWSQDVVSIRNLVRGLNPRPCAWTQAAGGCWRVLKVAICQTASPADPGTLLEVSTLGWRVRTGDRDLWLEDLCPEGPAMSGRASAHSPGAAISPGLILGDVTASGEP